MQQLYVAGIILIFIILIILTIKKCFWSRKTKKLSYAPPTFVLRYDISDLLPHSAQTWILNPSCALMRAKAGAKIRFDQPTHPAPGFVLSMMCGVPTPNVLELCAVSQP